MNETNGVMMQYFHWYSPDNGTLWREVRASAAQLASLGITSLWLPPAYKGSGGSSDVGYGAYDLFDLGEFDQKGSVRTKYGTRAELLAACAAARQAGIRIYADAVFNHKMGGDAQEEVEATPFDPENRTEPAGAPLIIHPWTHFTFPGRKTRYSSMEWRWHHFTAVDGDEGAGPQIFLFRDKAFDRNVDSEKGNYDYLMGCDVDTSHPEVRAELEHWGEWFVRTTGVDGFRFDAAKHIEAGFFRDWMHAVTARTGKELFAVAEYWSYDVDTLQQFIGVTEGRVSLFDAPLHHKFHIASTSGASFDLARIFDDTLVERDPFHAVTLVENHDSQPLQALESVVEPWFKPLAYALILLRLDGYPCVFYADYFGAEYSDTGSDGGTYDIQLVPHKFMLDRFLLARQHHAYGAQHDYFDHPNCIGWTRAGSTAHPGGLAVVMSNSEAGTKRMQLGQPMAVYRDITGHVDTPITTDADGWAEFACAAGAVSVWIPDAASRTPAARG